MVYWLIGLKGGILPDEVDMNFVEFTEIGGKWNFNTVAFEQFKYSNGYIVQ